MLAAQGAALALHLCGCGRTGEAGKHDTSLCAGLTDPRAQARDVQPSPFSKDVLRVLRLHGVACKEQAVAVEGVFSIRLELPGAEPALGAACWYTLPQLHCTFLGKSLHQLGCSCRVVLVIGMFCRGTVHGAIV